MSAQAALIVAIVVAVALAALLVLTTARRRDQAKAVGRLSRETIKRDRGDDAAVLGPTEAAPVTGRELERLAKAEREEAAGAVPATVAPAPPPAVPMDPETLGVTRRQFLNRGIITAMTVSLGAFGATMLAFLWPELSGGFGAKIKAGSLDDIMAQIQEKKTPFYSPEGRFYINPYPKDAVPKAKAIAAYGPVIPGYQSGVVALYQRCVHLGCRVPWCLTSQWFECPCHGSQYNRVGEKKGGPAPRGLDRFVVTVEGGQVNVDTKSVVQGPPIGTNTTGQEAEGPHCVGGRGE